MFNKIIMALFAAFAIVGLNVGSVLAWDFTVSGKAECNTSTGDWDLIWTVQNPEDEDLKITESNRTRVPVDSTVAAKTSKEFTESLPGSTSGEQNLTIKVEWPSDKNRPAKTAKVNLDGTCKKKVTEQPTPPKEEGGRGGEVQAATTTTPKVNPKVTVPKGRVVAGEGGVSATSLSAGLGLLGSVALLTLGARRLHSQED